MPVENIISKDQANVILSDKLFPDNKRLSQALRPRLFGIREPHPPLLPIAQKALKPRQILRSRYDENIPDPGQHQHRKGIINHGLVVNGQQLLADRLGDRVQTRPGPASKDNSLKFL